MDILTIGAIAVPSLVIMVHYKYTKDIAIIKEILRRSHEETESVEERLLEDSQMERQKVESLLREIDELRKENQELQKQKDEFEKRVALANNNENIKNIFLKISKEMYDKLRRGKGEELDLSDFSQQLDSEPFEVKKEKPTLKESEVKKRKKVQLTENSTLKEDKIKKINEAEDEIKAKEPITNNKESVPQSNKETMHREERVVEENTKKESSEVADKPKEDKALDVDEDERGEELQDKEWAEEEKDAQTQQEESNDLDDLDDLDDNSEFVSSDQSTEDEVEESGVDQEAVKDAPEDDDLEDIDEDEEESPEEQKAASKEIDSEVELDIIEKFVSEFKELIELDGGKEGENYFTAASLGKDENEFKCELAFINDKSLHALDLKAYVLLNENEWQGEEGDNEKLSTEVTNYLQYISDPSYLESLLSTIPEGMEYDKSSIIIAVKDNIQVDILKKVAGDFDFTKFNIEVKNFNDVNDIFL